MFKALTRFCGARAFHTSARVSDKTRSDPKRLAKRLQTVRKKNKQNPESHPLYMEIPKALRFIRAAEVGESFTKSTISLLITVIPEKGSKPLSGAINLPNPVKPNKLLIFSQTPLELANLDPAYYVVGGPELVDKIHAGDFSVSGFTHSFCSTDMLASLKPVGRLLGVRNLMCAPRKGNVGAVEDLPRIIDESLGSIQFKQKGQHLSFPIARCDFSDKQVLENIAVASQTIHKLQPPGTKKPNLIGQTCISSTKGPSLVINFKS